MHTKQHRLPSWQQACSSPRLNHASFIMTWFIDGVAFQLLRIHTPRMAFVEAFAREASNLSTLSPAHTAITQQSCYIKSSKSCLAMPLESVPKLIKNLDTTILFNAPWLKRGIELCFSYCRDVHKARWFIHIWRKRKLTNTHLKSHAIKS